MRSVKIATCKTPLSGTVSFPGDKSLSHRAILFGSLAEGKSHFTNVLAGEDCVCTRQAFKQMGVNIESSKDGTELRIDGVGLHGLKAPKSELYLGNSGTSMRLLMGVLAGQSFSATLTGDPSLSSRPMKRVTEPLRKMGAKIEGKDNGNLAPIKITGSKLKGIDYAMPMASAQVKSAILLAGLYADSVTSVTEPFNSRDHTERFLNYFGGNDAAKWKDGRTVSVEGGQALKAKSFAIAGDISSAAFFMAIAALLPESDLQFNSVLWNPSRTGLVDVMERMDVSFKKNTKPYVGPEPVGDFKISRGRDLRAFDIPELSLPQLIDEIPILCVLATQAKGESVIHDADELRVKETDRIHSMVSQLTKMGAKIKAEGNSIHIEGPTKMRGAVVNSFKDHRTAMSLIVAGLIAEGETIVEDIDCIDTSFPTFFELLKKIGAQFQIINK